MRTGLFRRKRTTPDRTATPHVVEIHLAQPMQPSARHEHEDGIVDRLLPQLGASGEAVGEVGWHDDTYRGHDGVVYLFSGPSSAAILDRLRAEIPRHALLAAAELRSGA